MDLIQQVIEGQRYALSQTLTQIENQTAAGRDALKALFPHTGRAYLIGVTGSPGSGKSTLVFRLVQEIRKNLTEAKIAVVAVDPTSPYSGGAVLGDRIRMRDLTEDKGVFIRSMASRGSLGGLSKATAGVVLAFDSAGYDFIIIETVGAGQAEVEIARLAHTTLVVEAPGMGDDIQAIKSGILEIADILVVNKADRQGAENTVKALQTMVDMAEAGKQKDAEWNTPVLKTAALKAEGLTDLLEKVFAHRAHLEKHQQLERINKNRLENQLLDTIREQLFYNWQNKVDPGDYGEILNKMVSRKISPAEAVEKLMKDEDK